jgi:hypothetical protein
MDWLILIIWVLIMWWFVGCLTDKYMEEEKDKRRGWDKIKFYEILK